VLFTVTCPIGILRCTSISRPVICRHRANAAFGSPTALRANSRRRGTVMNFNTKSRPVPFWCKGRPIQLVGWADAGSPASCAQGDLLEV